MNIDIRKDGPEVEAAITSFVPYRGDVTFSFRFNCGSQTYAALLTNDLRAQFEHETRQIREDAYLAGWADKRARRNKETVFPTRMTYRYGRR